MSLSVRIRLRIGNGIRNEAAGAPGLYRSKTVDAMLADRTLLGSNALW
ncbi:hypothetical protein [Mycolicibacterium komossense]|uniref:Uncharacterized protein n=1 Tax=Mycolicibacterium komossense TaxID=1779 RepID=A0ABT3C7E7_9MYCO|nr:hypothetical protein [Mycolicibacterium komossense]MCV7225350.1 hypothetical protein [Mycolicibacterium komossense]